MVAKVVANAAAEGAATKAEGRTVSLDTVVRCYLLAVLLFSERCALTTELSCTVWTLFILILFIFIPYYY